MDLGRVEYQEAWDLQRDLVARRLKETIPDVLLLLEHPPVYTVGRRGSEADLKGLGLPVYRVERGGDVTYHGPGQLVGYPILALSRGKLDVKGYITDLEEVLIRTVAEFGVKGGRGLHAGLWVGSKKLASIGLAIKHYVAYHGFALNVNPDLTPFRRVQPCGIEGHYITSMYEILGRETPMEDVKAALVHSFSEIFGGEMLLSGDVPSLKEALKAISATGTV